LALVYFLAVCSLLQVVVEPLAIEAVVAVVAVIAHQPQLLLLLILLTPLR